MARRSVQRSSTRRSTPNRSWTGSFSATTATVGAASKVLLGSFSLSNSNIDETVLRTVGVISIQSDQVAADELQIGAFGLIIVSDLAVAAGAASIPGPITDRADDGWFVYVPFCQSLEFISAVGVLPDMATQYQFDSKAKRKIAEGQNIAIMVENANSAGAFAIMNVFRMLSQVTGT